MSPTLVDVSVTWWNEMFATSDHSPSACFAAVCCADVNAWKWSKGSLSR
jgi:hypothetical protein